MSFRSCIIGDIFSFAGISAAGQNIGLLSGSAVDWSKMMDVWASGKDVFEYSSYATLDETGAYTQVLFADFSCA